MKRSYMKYFAALLLFGFNGIVASFIDLSSYEIVLLRTFIGSVLLIALFFLTRNKLTFYQYKNDSLFLLLSGIAMGTSWMFLYEAYAQIGVSIASLCYYCGPVIVMALSPLLFREKLTASKLCGFAAVLIGIILVNGSAFDGNGNLWGIFCGLMSAVMYAAMVICNKKARRITGKENATLQLLVSFLTVFIFVLFKQGLTVHLHTEDIIPVLILGLFNTGIGCYFYFSSIGKLPVQTVAVCGYLEPLSAVVFSVIVLHETMLPIRILGAALIIGGAVSSELVKRKTS
ncbi:DMT family transporter [Ruminococcus difficilis]|uniref:EamA family transporter n=1 Tax=Ruminococcus difficilis TaxID=2763069 RepID=A0A934U1Y7_9FIRM|nr:DMT family transporter [Ruminococcus difficilis]MBK6087884.1 EamA family transporter [Ruminococcus difficilis]